MSATPFESLLATCAALVLAASLGTAQAASERVEVRGQPLPVLTAAEGAALQGRYQLSDGRRLEVARQGRRLLMTLDGEDEQALRALSPTRLQSADGLTLLDFTAAPNGSIWQVKMATSGPAVRLASR